MRSYFRMSKIIVAVLLVVCVAGIALAQDRGGRGRWQMRDPEEMRAMMLQRFQEMLEAEDEEWKVISPLLEDVMQKSMEARGSRGRGMGFMMGGPPGGPGGPGGPDGQREEAGNRNRDRGDRGDADGRRSRRFGEPDPEMDALREILDNEEASAADIKVKLKDLRDARDKKDEELKKVREELRQVLTLRQEATLVLMGMLD